MRSLLTLFLFLFIMSVACAGKEDKAPKADEGKPAVQAAKSQWLSDPVEARKMATAAKLPILINFEGSDWCHWCELLDKEVFEKKEFQDYARQNLILLALDFPQQKPQPPEVAQRNEEMSRKYNVEGFPTLLITDASGTEIGRMVGYQAGGAAAFVKKVKDILNKSGAKKSG